MAWFPEPPSALAPFLHEVRLTVESWPAPSEPARFLVAFSGGLDSTLLLAAFCRLAGSANVRAAHVDHGLQAESVSWAAQCAAVTARLGVPLTTVQVDVDRTGGHGLEAAARDVRYGALREILLPGEVLLTAHHADDQLETLLLRALRGTGVRGLRGIIEFGPFAGGFLGRPLLAHTRAQLHAQARAWGLHWLEDPSNRERRHDRNFLRLQVLPHLSERWPAAAHKAQRLAAQMSDAEEILETVAQRDAQALIDPRCVPRDQLLGLAAARQRNLLRHLLRRAGLGVPSAHKIDELRLALLHARPAAHPLIRWAGGEGRVFRGQLYLLEALPPTSVHSYRAALDGRRGWSGPEGEIAFEPVVSGPGLPQSWLDAGLELRFRGGGEQFQPLERRHSQPLKRWLQEAAIVPWMRSRIPLLFRGERLVAVADLWVADDVRAAGPDEPRWRVVWTRHLPVR
jgi:tRNA(Ile)-lysidine synthase